MHAWHRSETEKHLALTVETTIWGCSSSLSEGEGEGHLSPLAGFSAALNIDQKMLIC